MSLNSISETLEDLRNGKMIIVVDDENRENEGDFIIPAETATPEAINFMITHGRGLVCMPMKSADLERLQLHPMVENNTDPFHTAFTISVDHKSTSTGISAFERADTIKQLINEQNTRTDFIAPGHVFPLRAKDGGVLERNGHTEAAVDLAELAGFKPAGVICEIILPDGTMARLPQLIEMAKKWNLKIISIEDLIAYKKNNHKSITREAKVKMPTKFGNFDLYAYSAPDSSEPHIALVKGDIQNSTEPVLTRVHSECFTGDLLGSLRCDCGSQLERSLKAIDERKCGILLYLRQEGRGIGLLNKIKSYQFQEKGLDTVDANLKLGFEPELRNYQIGSEILKDLGVNSIELMTNNPHKIEQLNRYGIEVQRKAIEIDPNPENIKYFQAKKDRMGHLLTCCN
ncbi:MAG: bifunctional 3,4-dihydroxy-2-butanone-4-phosphate synthase/GTP cyclohydrolase II [Candidatus Cloacimonetes bacterium]|nr:bifunctional 3,4-dihydroxy-2-butanone-4-phosphate synthase/GTP cyclohydrolase II [Candidatus Cloacimonadota bacterium]